MCRERGDQIFLHRTGDLRLDPDHRVVNRHRPWAGRAMTIVDRPEPGWFRTKLVKGGPWVPARIWWSVAADPVTGERLDRSPVLLGEIDGKPADPVQMWSRVCDSRITAAEFNFMTADAGWCRENAPAEPKANPTLRLDLNAAPSLF